MDRQKDKIMDELIINVKEWADAKGLLKEENSQAQMLKVLEEVGETAGAMLKKNEPEVIDGLGDSFVTLIILCYQLGLEPKDCLQAAWNEIKDRKGKTVDGTFIREQ
jgi:NTP pyrophosphatase (non-canonical NTP hydrolase)